MTEEILNIGEEIVVDESIESYEFHEYVASSGGLNNNGEIRIIIETQDLFTHPSESFLLVEGRLTKDDGSSYADADKVTLTNNGIMHLFKYIKYSLSGQEIEYVNHPGQASTMLGLLKFPDDFSKSKGLNSLWYKDTSTEAEETNIGFKIRQHYIIKSPDPKGSFSFRIPLKHIFGFAEDYNKSIYGFKQQLSFYRSQDDDAIYRDAAIGAGKVTLDKLSWYMPHVLPSDESKFKLYKQIEQKKTFQVGFRKRQCETFTVPQSTNFTWRLSVKSSPEKPRWIIIGFQTDKSGDQTKNPSTFNHLNVRDIHVTLNSRRYPEVNYDLSFPQQKFSRAFGDAVEFRSKYYNMDELISNANISPPDYKSLYPLFVFDVSKQSEKLKSSMTDIQVRTTFSENPSKNTEAYAIVISDKLLSFVSDGNRLNVIQG